MRILPSAPRPGNGRSRQHYPRQQRSDGSYPPLDPAYIATVLTAHLAAHPQSSADGLGLVEISDEEEGRQP